MLLMRLRLTGECCDMISSGESSANRTVRLSVGKGQEDMEMLLSGERGGVGGDKQVSCPGAGVELVVLGAQSIGVVPELVGDRVVGDPEGTMARLVGRMY